MATKWSPAMRRYQLRFWPTMGLYAAVLVGVIWVIRHAAPPPPFNYIVAVLPALPILGVIVIVARYLVEETDEFRRMLAAQGMLWGLAATLAVTTVWGFLQALAGAPNIPLYHVFPIFCVGMGVANAVLGWRYR